MSSVRTEFVVALLCTICSSVLYHFEAFVKNADVQRGRNAAFFFISQGSRENRCG